MYKECHSIQLKKLVQNNYQQNVNVENLLWKLLMTYADIQDSDKAIHEMKG